jgi:hypothetical protein
MPSPPRPPTLNSIAAANKRTCCRAAVLVSVNCPLPQAITTKVMDAPVKAPPTEPPIEPTTNPTIEDVGQVVKMMAAVVVAAAAMVAAIAAAVAAALIFTNF